jgi:hypothetical protein
MRIGSTSLGMRLDGSYLSGSRGLPVSKSTTFDGLSTISRDKILSWLKNRRDARLKNMNRFWSAYSVSTWMRLKGSGTLPTHHISSSTRMSSRGVSEQWKKSVTACSLYPPSPPKVRNEKGESPPGHLIFCLGSHDTSDYMELSARTAVEVILANREDGANWTFMGAMCIVAAYQLWEDHYRSRIAAHLGREKLQIPIFGDLRRLRRCIIHNRGRWLEDAGKLECFELEEIGDDKSSELVFTRKNMLSIWWRMRLALRDLRKADSVRNAKA